MEDSPPERVFTVEDADELIPALQPSLERIREARQVVLDNCGISVVVRESGRTTVSTLNAAFHLQGVAA